MEQHVAQFLADFLLITFKQGISEFKRFFNCVRAQAFECLFLIPWTFFAKFVHYLQQAYECCCLFFYGMHAYNQFSI